MTESIQEINIFDYLKSSPKKAHHSPEAVRELQESFLIDNINKIDSKLTSTCDGIKTTVETNKSCTSKCITEFVSSSSLLPYDLSSELSQLIAQILLELAPRSFSSSIISPLFNKNITVAELTSYMEYLSKHSTLLTQTFDGSDIESSLDDCVIDLTNVNNEEPPSKEDERSSNQSTTKDSESIEAYCNQLNNSISVKTPQILGK